MTTVAEKRVIEIWRDKNQSRAGKPVLWVVYAEDGIVKETLNASDPHTDPAAAILFAHTEAKRLTATLRPLPKEV
jgi:hypothetical protein